MLFIHQDKSILSFLSLTIAKKGKLNGFGRQFLIFFIRIFIKAYTPKDSRCKIKKWSIMYMTWSYFLSRNNGRHIVNKRTSNKDSIWIEMLVCVNVKPDGSRNINKVGFSSFRNLIMLQSVGKIILMINTNMKEKMLQFSCNVHKMQLSVLKYYIVWKIES